MRKPSPISISSPRDTSTSRPSASAASASITAAGGDRPARARENRTGGGDGERIADRTRQLVDRREIAQLHRVKATRLLRVFLVRLRNRARRLLLVRVHDDRHRLGGIVREEE